MDQDKDKTNDQTPNELETLKTQNADLIKRLEALESRQPKPQDEGDNNNDSLANKTKQQREIQEKQNQDAKKLESALTFTLKSGDWLKTHAALLPKTIPQLFAQAEKENYSSSVEKAAAIKEGVVSEFFAVQENLDLLTDHQKIVLEDFKKLTKNERQIRVQEIFDSLFEPTFNTLKLMRKAEQLRNGHGDPSSAETAYKQKLVKISEKQYLGVK